MPLVLVISSHVAASRVGAKAVELALQARKIDAVVCPTTLLGRRPDLGAPGGGAVPAELLKGMLEGVEAQGLFAMLDAVAVGYCVGPEQARVIADALDRVRAANPRALIAVDPIMGDAPHGLYVRAETAAAIAALLVPRADLIAPNLWELGRLADGLAGGPISAALALGKPALVSSIEDGGEIGAIYVDAAGAWGAFAAKSPAAPKGTGDLLFGAFLAAQIEGLPAPQALHRAVGVCADVIAKAAAWGAPELPIVAAIDSFIAPAVRVRLKDLTQEELRP